MKALAHLLRYGAGLPGLALLAACGGGGGGSAAIPVAHATPTTAPPAGTTVTIPLHGATPTIMAYQSGTSGAWTKLTPSGGTATFTLPVGTTAYSVAAFCPQNNIGISPDRDGPAEVVIQATTADSPDMFCVSTTSIVSVPATVFFEANQFPNTDSYLGTQLVAGRFSGPAIGGAAGGDAFGSPLWYAGTSDFITAVYNPTFTAIAAHIYRNQTITPDETLTLDPLSKTNDAVTTTPVTVPATASGAVYWMMAEGGGEQVQFFNSGPTTINAAQIPSASATAGDFYEMRVSQVNGTSFAFQLTSASTLGAINAALPSAAFNYTAATQIGDLCSMNIPYSGFTVSGTKYYSVTLSWAETIAPTAAGAPVLNVVATQSYLGAGTTVTVPDLSAVTGMLPNPTGGNAVAAIAEAYTASGTVVWDDMLTGNAFAEDPVGNSTTFQAVQSNYFNYTAP